LVVLPSVYKVAESTGIGETAYHTFGISVATRSTQMTTTMVDYQQYYPMETDIESGIASPAQHHAFAFRAFGIPVSRDTRRYKDHQMLT
jgi:hypothetical protein